jgi:hypothetical protein
LSACQASARHFAIIPGKEKYQIKSMSYAEISIPQRIFFDNKMGEIGYEFPFFSCLAQFMQLL